MSALPLIANKDRTRSDVSNVRQKRVESSAKEGPRMGMARRKFLADGGTVRFSAFVWLSLPRDVLVRGLIK
jgi:hypothetical protein